MKTTLTALAVAALALSATPSTAENSGQTTTIDVTFETQSLKEGATLAPGATLVNSKTGKELVYDSTAEPPLNPPFDLTKGLIFEEPELKTSSEESLMSLSLSEGQTLNLDFTDTTANYGAYLHAPEYADKYEYLMFAFENVNFAEWYKASPVTIIGTFNDNYVYTAYVVMDACDWVEGDAFSKSTYGSIVFFRDDVAQEIESNVPEPTTATLSLLALCGLAARRRRK